VHVCVVSALPRKQTWIWHGRDVRFVPKADIRLLSPMSLIAAGEIALPPESDRAGPGSLVALHAPLRPAEVAPPAAVAAPIDADAHQSGDDARHPGGLHCRVVVAAVDADALQSGDDARRPGEPHCQVVVVYHQDVLRHLASDRSKAVQAECLGPRDAHQNHRGAPVEYSETPDAYRGVPEDRWEFQDDYQDDSDAPAERSGVRVRHQDAPAEGSGVRVRHQDAPAFRDDRQACRDAPAYRRAVQGDCRGDRVSRVVPVA